MERTTQRAIADGNSPAASLGDGHDGSPLARGNERAEGSEPREDFAPGQVVVIAGRWLLVLAGLLLTLWEPGAIKLVRVELFGLLCLAVANFYLHAQLLMRRPVERQVAYIASMADLTLITLLILVQGGLPSELYVFYFPAILALSVAFPPATTFTLAGGAIAAYGAVAFASTAFNLTDVALQTIVVRCLMLAAAAFCGTLYWRIERDRREEALAFDGGAVSPARLPTSAPSD